MGEEKRGEVEVDGRENRDAVLGSKKGSPLTKAVGRVNITTTSNAERGKKRRWREKISELLLYGTD